MNTNEYSIRRNLKALPKAVWVLFFGTFLNKFGTFVLPFLAVYVTRQGYSKSQAGLAVGAFGLGHLLAAMAGGYLADTFGRRKTIVLSMFSTAIVMLSLGLARGLVAIIVFSALTGLTGELYRPASTALLTDLVPPGQRLTAFATYRMVFNAGWAFGPMIGGLLAQKSYFWLFVGDAATSLLFGVVAWLALPRSNPPASSENGWKAMWRALRGDQRFAQLLCATVAVGLVFMQICSTLSLEITQHGLSAATYGMILSVNGLLVVLFELPITSITRRYPSRAMMALGFVLLGMGFSMNGLAHTRLSFVVAIAVLTLGEIISMPVAIAYVSNLAPPHLRGRYMGLYGLTWALTLVFGPSLGMLVYSFNPILLWGSCAMLGLLAAGIISLDLKSYCTGT